MNRSDWKWLAFVSAIVAVLCGLAWVSIAGGSEPGMVPVAPRPTCTTYTSASWQWSPIAPYHAAVVKVRCHSGGFMSGALVKHGGAYGVLTARHGINSNTTTIRLHNGQELTGNLTHTDKYGSDSAWIVLGSEAAAAIGTLPPLAIAARPPQPGDRLEVCGYGGQEAGFRHFYCQFRGFEQLDGQITRTTGTFISGDSGGPILNDAHEVVSLVTGSEQNINPNGGMAICLNGYGPHWTYLAAFVGRVTETAGCPPGQSCPPGGCPPGQGQPGSFSPGFIRQGEIGIFRRRSQQPGGQQPGSGFYPPQQPIPQPVPIDSLPPLPLVPPIPPTPQIDIVKLKADITADLTKVIEAAIAKIPAGPAGPPGQTGAPGLAGKDGAAGLQGPPGTPADLAKLAAIEARLAAVEAKANQPIYFKKTNTVTGLPVGETEAVHLGEGFEFRLTPHK